jgi:hypothetical protein
MTVADLLSAMSVLDNELDVSSGGADESRAIAAAGMAQDAFESVVAGIPEVLGTVGTLSTTANQENTTWPSALMRADSLWMINATTNLPEYQLDEIQDVGGQANVNPFFPFGAYNASPGRPAAYFTNRANFYWKPVPDAVYTIRVYGYYAKTALTTRAQTMELPNQVKTPMASFAVRMMSIGVGDDEEETRRLANELYTPVIKMLQSPTVQRPQSRYYSRMHTT